MTQVDGALAVNREAFDVLLATLDPVRERAGERYEAIRARLLRFLRSRGAPRPEDLADEAIDRVCRKLAEGGTIRVSLERYILGVARRVSLEAWRGERRRREKAAALSAALQAQRAHGAADDDALCGLERCLDALAPQSRRLLLRYYGDDGIERRAAIARELGLTSNALRVRLHRLRARLRNDASRAES